MCEDGFVGLPLAVLDAVVILWVGGEGVTRSQVGQVALDVAGGAAAAGGGETDVGGHLRREE